MYLDNYFNSHTGKLTDISTYHSNYSGYIHLTVEFDDGFNSKGNYANQLVMQDFKPLGKRLGRLNLSQYLGQKITITRIENTTVFLFYLPDRDNGIPIGVISQSLDEWEDAETEELWKCYQQGCSTDDLAKIFGRDEREQIIPQINSLLKNRINYTPIHPKGGLSNFLSCPPNCMYVVGASTDGRTGEWKSSNEGGKMGEEESLFKIARKVDVKNDRPFQTILSFTINNETGKIENTRDGALKISDKIEEKLQKSLVDENSFLGANIKRLEKKESYYVWIRLEDFDKDGNYHSYYYAISDEEDTLHRFRDRDGEFLRYIMYLKSQLSHEHNELLKKQEQEIKRQSIKSAIAFIMSRNMSHNLGSHYLDYTQSDLSELSQTLKDKFLDSVDHQTSKKKNYRANFESLIKETQRSYYFIKGSEKTLEFIRNRMYYLATITDNTFSQPLPVQLTSEILPAIITTEDNDFTNFYLKNLVRSEDYSDHDERYGAISVEVNEQESLNSLNEISVALPLGSVSSHAIYNIIENFIRNSAKYQCGSCDKPKDLNFKIIINEGKELGDLVVKVHDDKKQGNKLHKDGKTLVEWLNGRLTNLHFINADDNINNDDKGLKEMLLSSFWVNARHDGKSISEVVYDFEKGSEDRKLEFLEKYGFTFILADDKESLGIKFHLNQHFKVLSYQEREKYPYLTSDIVTVPDEATHEWHYVREFNNSERFDELDSAINNSVAAEASGEDYNNTINLLSAIEHNLALNIDPFIVDMNDTCEEDYYENNNTQAIVFSTHMSSKTSDLGNKRDVEDRYKAYAYYDSISGSNFTKQLEDFYLSTYNGSHFKSWNSKYTSILIKESALTRIAIIDECFFNTTDFTTIDNYRTKEQIKGTSLELDFRNIQLLNISESNTKNIYSFPSIGFEKEKPSENTEEHFVGNSFRNVGIPFKQNGKDYYWPHFISIHFGIIQKLLGHREFSKENVNSIIDSILKSLNYAEGKKYIRIAIHTGRGSLSEEQKKALADYCIIPRETLRAAFNNSKYILCQLFNNLKYKTQK